MNILNNGLITMTLTGSDLIKERLKYIRKKHLKLTQSELAGELEIVPSFISDIERGKSIITSKIILGLSEKFNVSIDYLLTGEGKTFLQTDTSSRILDPKGDYAVKRNADFYESKIQHTGWFMKLSEDKKFLAVSLNKLSDETARRFRYAVEFEIEAQIRREEEESKTKR